MKTAVLRYRVMAYITGVLIIIVVFAGIPLQIWAHNTFIANDIAQPRGRGDDTFQPGRSDGHEIN